MRRKIGYDAYDKQFLAGGRAYETHYVSYSILNFYLLNRL